jgi:TrmH family RNA methyltransferase
MQITSTSNSLIKSIRKLKDRDTRRSSGLFLAEGIRIVIEALQTGAQIDTLITCPELLQSDHANEAIHDHQKQVDHFLEVSPEVFSTISVKEGPSGLAATIHQKWVGLEHIHPSDRDLWVCLEEIADPGNLGTVCRTADAVGARGLILIGNCTDPYDPSAVRASMGALFTQQFTRCSHDEFITTVQRDHWQVIGTSDKAQLNYREYTYPSPVCILMGSERNGMSDDLSKICVQVVGIPMSGRSDSLNLAVAAGVVLYEAAYQMNWKQEQIK